MDVLDTARPPTSVDTSSPSPQHPASGSTTAPASMSNTQLAALLTDAYRDIDNLRSEVKAQRKRAEKAEKVVHILQIDPTSSPGSTAGTTTTNGASNQDIQQLQQKHNETVARLLEDYEERMRQAETAREDAENRRRVAQEGWDQLDRYLANLELRAKDARTAFARISSGSPAGTLSLPALPSPTSLRASSPSAGAHHYAMAPPGAVPRHSSRHSSSRSAPGLFPLPPHPNPNPSGAYSSSTRRPRTPSVDAYAAGQPPTKRSRGNADDQRGREPRTSYSESYIQQHQHHDSRDFQDQLRVRQQQLLQRQHPEARIIDRKYGTPYPPGYHRPGSPGHSRSGSRSSQSSVEDFILDAAGVAGGQPAPSNGSRYYDGARESPRPHSAATNHQGIATNPYPTTGFPANQSTPGSMRSVQGSQNHVYTTHVFAPVVTGAPTKKSKFPNTANNQPGMPGSGPSIDTPQAQSSTPTTVPFAATNAQGQRICRQCGMVGRYKEGKCVEKWGPGPMGPGTVCDRCRKKMKRVERRGTLESQQQLQNMVVQQQQYQPRTTSHTQLPLSQGSDRSVQRSDTLLTTQASHGPSSFAQSRTEDKPQQQRTAANSTTNVSPARQSSRHAPTPPTIAALREQHDDEEDEQDPDQLPTSNIGRGGSAAHSRSTSRNGRAAGSGNGANGTKRSSLAARGSISPRVDMEVDEMDADADADAEAEAEAEIMGAVDAAEGEEGEGEGDGEGDIEADADAEAELLEAVDAAEANSSSSHGGERGWLKAES